MRQPARRSKGARKPQGKPRAGLRRELRPARSRRTSAAHEASIAHIGSTARNDLNSRSRPPLNAQGPSIDSTLNIGRAGGWIGFAAVHGHRSDAPLRRRHTCTESRQRERHAPRERIRRGGSCGTGRSGVRRCCSARAPCRCSAAGSRRVCDATSGCRVHDTLGIEQP